ncbi:MAG: response regulator receiver protein [Acidobacteria bacterium]|nr:response regulator receiver protein [Acidobacteriota bacterium]
MGEKNNKPVIFILDDEEIVLTTLKNLFMLRTDYHIICHNSPQQALANAPASLVDVVIADYLMPQMDGITFLSKFKEVQPQAIRILLTGYADKENAIRAINTVGLYQYLEKPWDNDALLMVVRNGMEKRSLLQTLEKKFAELDRAHADIKSVRNELFRAFM